MSNSRQRDYCVNTERISFVILIFIFFFLNSTRPVRIVRSFFFVFKNKSMFECAKTMSGFPSPGLVDAWSAWAPLSLSPFRYLPSARVYKHTHTFAYTAITCVFFFLWVPIFSPLFRYLLFSVHFPVLIFFFFSFFSQRTVWPFVAKYHASPATLTNPAVVFFCYLLSLLPPFPSYRMDEDFPACWPRRRIFSSHSIHTR